MITTLLIANRGEIACRIIRTCRRLGIRTVAVYSTADAGAPHVLQADEAVWIGAAPPSESYLRAAALIEAAQRTGAQAIHPGYGFLSENADFAAQCAAAGLIFIGPTPAAIALMGNKRAAKQCALAANVPMVPGSPLDAALDDAALLAQAEQIGWPMMIKAAAGGGGLGMRLVHSSAELAAALPVARRDAQAAFGSAEVLLERAVIEPRHIEVQIFGDQHGNLIHLGERECSIQRRHQKIIEEAPAAHLLPEVRERILAAALAVGQAIGYTSAGTIEFLVDRNQQFYFLEMNTRLQVEHPVTEAVTGLDLVEWQILVAEGAPLPLTQAQVTLRGHAIEARVYAEDPAAGFAPTSGPVALWQPPTDAAVRVESGIATGASVSVYYDPMLAKIITYGPDRQSAVRCLAYALEQTTLLGCTNNLLFLAALARHPAFLAGDLSTAFLTHHGAALTAARDSGEHALEVAAVTLLQWSEITAHTAGYWRNSPNAPQQFRYQINTAAVAAALTPAQPGAPLHIAVDQTALIISSYSISGHTITMVVDGRRRSWRWACVADEWWITDGRSLVRLRTLPLLPEPQTGADAGGSLRAPMPGAVLAILVGVGDHVAAGQPLLKLEAMKMEHTIRTAAAGTVSAIYCQAGETVEADAVLIAIEED